MKSKRMKPVKAWAIVNKYQRTKTGWLYDTQEWANRSVIESKGERVAQVLITEVPRKVKHG